MGMLDKAKNDGDKKAEAADDKKDVKGKEKHKKKVKHPAASQTVDDGTDAGADEEGAGEQDGADTDADADQAPGGAAQAAPSAGAQGGEGEDQQEANGAQPDEQADQGGNAQGGPPSVQNAQAPGAGDDTSGGEDTPDGDEDQDAGGDAPAGAPSAQGGPQGATMQQVPMSPALKEEYQNLDRQLVQKLYHGGVAEHILPSLFPQGPHKIKGVVQMSVLLAREIFIQAKAPLQLTLPFARDAAAHVMQIGEQVKGIQYSDQECTAIFGAVYEGMLRAFGVKKSAFHHMQGLIPRSQFSHHAKAYVAAHGHAQQAANANNTQEHRDDQPTGGPAQAAGPQADQGAPPGAGGGMLSQAQGAQGGGEPEPAEGGGEEEGAE